MPIPSGTGPVRILLLALTFAVTPAGGPDGAGATSLRAGAGTGGVTVGGPDTPTAASGAPGGGDRPATSLPAARAVPDTIRLVDDEGGLVVLERSAGRIVSLVPALTEVLFAIGAGDRLVGRTRFDRHPPEAGRIPSVGDGVRPSAEAVLARDPDLVVLFAGPDNRGTAVEMRRLGLPVVAVRHNTLDDLERNIRRLGEATGCKAAARDLVEEIDGMLARVAAATAGLPRRTIYYEVWSDPPFTVGAGSYLDSLISLAGGRNAFGDVEAPSPPVSLEAIAAREPELVLWPVADGSGGVPPSERPGWRAVEAVRRGAVRRVDGDLLHRLGPRVGEAALHLARAIHPEAGSGLALPPGAGTARGGCRAGRASVP